MKTWTTRVCLGVAILAGLYLLNYLIAPLLVGDAKLQSLCRPHYSQKFDALLWRNSGWIDDGKHGKFGPSFGKRFEMVDDLLASHLVVGMGSDQVKALIGDPDGGMIDKEYVLATLDPYGGPRPKLDKEILESTDAITVWVYRLAHQSRYPAQSLLFPMLFFNGDEWKLVVELRNGKVHRISVGG